MRLHLKEIYNSRNYYRLLNTSLSISGTISTTVEITIGYLTRCRHILGNDIYNSRNYYRLLNSANATLSICIYNSRNYYRLLNLYDKYYKGYNLQQ